MKRFLCFVLPALLLSGCWDSNEAERMYYVYGVGVEYKDNQYKMYVQIIDFANVAKTEQPNQDSSPVAIGEATGDTPFEAFFNLYHSTDLRLFWGHLSYVVFSDSVLHDRRANAVVNSLNRYRETRYQIWVYATDENVKEILQVTPILNKSITSSKLAVPINSFEQESYYQPVSFRELIMYLNEPPYEVAVPFINLEKNWEMKGEEGTHIDERGMSFSNSDHLITVLNKDESKGLRWLNSRAKRTSITYKNDGSSISVTIENIKPTVKVKKVGNSVKFDIEVKLDAILSDFLVEVSKEQVKKSVIEEIEKEIKETYKIGLERDIDVYRLSEVVYRKNNKLFKQLEENGKVPLNEDSIDSITINIERLSAARKEFTRTFGK